MCLKLENRKGESCILDLKEDFGKFPDMPTQKDGRRQG